MYHTNRNRSFFNTSDAPFLAAVAPVDDATTAAPTSSTRAAAAAAAAVDFSPGGNRRFCPTTDHVKWKPVSASQLWFGGALFRGVHPVL